MRPMRILLVSHYFPPYDHIGAARMGKIAKYLTRFGHDVRVLSARDQMTPFKTLAVEIPIDRIRYTPWFNALFRADLALCRIGTRLVRHDLAKSDSRELPECVEARPAGGAPQYGGILRAAAKALAKRARDSFRTVAYFPDAEIGWLPFALREGERMIAEARPEIIFASGGPPTSLMVGHLLSKGSGIPWVAELRDLWVDNHGYQHRPWRRRIEERLERSTLEDASALVTVSEPLALRLQKKYGKPTIVVFNGFDPNDFPSGVPIPFREGRIRIVYTGTITPGKQDPRPLFAALRDLGPLRDMVEVAFYRTNPADILPLAAALGVADRVEVHEGVPFAESLRIQCTADLLLYLSWTDPAQPGIMTGKLPQYFGAGRPILAVGPCDNDPARIIRDRGLGVALPDAVAISKQLREWIAVKRERREIAGPRPDAALEFSREFQTRRLEVLLTGLLSPSPTPLGPS